MQSEDNYNVPSNIATIAGYCPEEYGKIVHIARMIEAIDSLVVHDDSGCTFTAPRSEKTSLYSTPDQITISPNPTTDRFKVFSEEVITSYEIIDASGNLLKSRQINQSDFTITTTDLVEGIYIARFTLADFSVVSKKVIIIK